MKRILIPKLLLFLIIINFSSNAFSQKKDFLGVNISGEIRADGENLILNKNVGLHAGLSYERKFHNYFGAETGIYYRANPVNIFIQSGYVNQQTITEGFVSVPVLVKFYSGIVNVSLGGCFDYFIGGYDFKPESDISLIDYNIDPKFYLGIVCKISKDIKISEKLILEPEIKINGFPAPADHSFIGLGIKLKYGL